MDERFSASEMRELVEEARAEARAEALAEVKEELRERYVRVLRAQLDETEAETETEVRAEAPAAAPGPDPAPTPEAAGELVTYVYCVTDAGLGLSGGTGVAGAGVELVSASGLTAVVSQVPHAEFGEEALRRNLNDLQWLEAAARAHQQVIDEAAVTATIVPLRLCTIYTDAERVRAMLTEQRERFTEALDLLRGKSEWGVKVYGDLGALETAARERLGVDGANGAEGGAYFARKQAEREARESARQLARECVEEAHARFVEWAADAVVNRPQNRDLAGYEGEMLLNAAYLMEDERAEEFAALVRELQERYRDGGLRFDLTGPWPPYNFVPGRTETLL
jgi:hypothetical protein